MKQKFSITKFRRQEERPRSHRIRDRAGLSRQGRLGLSRSLLAYKQKRELSQAPFSSPATKKTFFTGVENRLSHDSLFSF